MKLEGQSNTYGIGLYKEIENHVMTCEPCQTLSRSKQKKPGIQMEILACLGKS